MNDDPRITVPEWDKRPGIVATVAGLLRPGASTVGGRKLDDPDPSLIGTINPGRQISFSEAGQPEPEPGRSRLIGTVGAWKIAAADPGPRPGDASKFSFPVASLFPSRREPSSNPTEGGAA
jgi:hypothetical protein